MYSTASLLLIFFCISIANVTAALKCPPDIFPTLYAIATTARPNASAVRIYPLPAASHPTSIAVPHPINTNTHVPIISDKYFFIKYSFLFLVFSPG